MHVLLAEKPSVARDIAAVLGHPQKVNGYLTAGTEWLVTWAFGHLVTLADPKTYDPTWEKWSFDTLPMLPDTFHLAPVPKSQGQLNCVKGLLNRRDVTDVICATDADREGEIIFRYIYRYSTCTKPVKRLWLSENTPAAIQTALKSMKPLSAYDDLAAAAEARSQADWLVGLNATRAFTLKHGQPGQGALSVGRVQTPTLRLIADRDAEIWAFQSVPYHQVSVTFQSPHGPYLALWTGMVGDHPDRILTQTEAQGIAAKVPVGTPGVIQSVEKKRVTIKPPLLFSLNDLQKEANRRFGLTAQQTLDVAQSLYEKHLTSYPRTDAKHLTTDVAATLGNRLHGLASLSPYSPLIAALAKPLNTTRIVDDTKVSEAGHYAIIPTGQKPSSDLSEQEANIFDLTVRRLVAALMSAGEDERTTMTTIAAAETFRTKGTAVVTLGWRVAVKTLPEGETDGKEEKDESAIPAGLHNGERVTVETSDILQKETKAPPKINDASLLALMEKHGLGTPATRARIVEVLLLRGYVTRQKKTVISTEKGRALLKVVPETVQSPELTGQWEAKLDAIAAGKEKAEGFIQAIRAYTQHIVQAAQRQTAAAIGTDLGSCPICQTGRIVAGNKGWGCSRWRDGCHFAIWHEVAGKKLSEAQVKTLLAGKTTSEIKGFKSKAGKGFSAKLKLETTTGKVEFVFAPRGTRRGA